MCVSACVCECVCKVGGMLKYVCVCVCVCECVCIVGGMLKYVCVSVSVCVSEYVCVCVCVCVSVYIVGGMLCNVSSLQLFQEALKAAPLSVSTRGTLQTQLHPLHSSLAHSGRPSPPHQRPMQHRQRHHFDTPTHCDGTRCCGNHNSQCSTGVEQVCECGWECGGEAASPRVCLCVFVLVR